MRHKPDSDDYLVLFHRYRADFGSIYLDPEDDRFQLLFDQVCAMLKRPSPFNLALPDPFRTTALRYLDGDPHTTAHMKTIANRHFMLSDLFDYIDLVHRLAQQG